MGKFPVISITLKGATGENFAEAKGMLRRIIGKESMRFQFLMQSNRLTELEHNQYKALINTDETGAYTMSDELLKDSLQLLSQLFYHGILLGLFAGMDGWKVKSNSESGEGYSDISVEVEDKEIGIIIEFKYAENASFDKSCSEALILINDRNY